VTHAELVEIGRRWLLRPWRSGKGSGHGACRIILTELSAYTTHGEIPDVLGFDSGKSHSILIECKTSRADFLADAKKPFRTNPAQGIGTQRWFLVPAGVLTAEDLPENWGLLEIREAGTVVVVRESGIFEKNAQSEVQLLVSTICRLNIESEGHVMIRAYLPLQKANKGKHKATFTIGEGEP